MRSLSCRYLLGMFLGSEGQGPLFVQIRLEIYLDGLVLAYHISFPATLSASDLRKAPFACNCPAG